MYSIIPSTSGKKQQKTHIACNSKQNASLDQVCSSMFSQSIQNQLIPVSMQFCGLKMRQKKIKSLPKAMTFVCIFSCLTSTPLFPHFPSWRFRHGFAFMCKYLRIRNSVTLFPKCQKLQKFGKISKWLTFKPIILILKFYAKDVYPHKFYST